ncbi:MAG: hypothetical protein IT257_04320 [Chitinophagaceae bacterium]|nr:hypothetical protein [Chitinophagaceae bacterium]
MKNCLKILFLLLVAQLQSCTEKMDDDEIRSIGMTRNKKAASFIQKLGLNPAQAAFSSSVNNVKGIVLLQAVAGFQDSFVRYQHPSWAQFGWMGSITADDSGNIYTAPIPFVNNLEHTLSNINSIYKIDQQTGEMELFYSLPKPDSVAGVIPFGVMGLYYDPHARKLYAASIAGSTRDEEKGKIYVIDIAKKEVTDQLDGVDAMAVFVGGITGEKKLYFGTCRNPELRSVLLSKSGHIVSKMQTELSLEGIGPRGNDKARRVRYDQKGNLLIYGIEFDYSLAANSNRVETLYKFTYSAGEKKWVLSETH